jgi:hypothetical protein
VYCRLLAIKIATPLLLSLELRNILYLGEKILVWPNVSVLSRVSERKMIEVCRAKIAATFLFCF